MEHAFGDPEDAANPVGFAALLAADARHEVPQEAERLLDGLRLGSEFVPVALGGRLDRADAVARVLRPVFRRDVALGFGYGITSLFAAAPVWAAGSASQRAWLSQLLRDGGRVSVVHHNLAHGNTMWQGELTARRAGRALVLDGRKDAVINAERSGAFVVYARTGEGHGPGAHSVLLVPGGEGRPAGLRVLPRQLSSGMRGCRFAGLELANAAVPGDAMVGEPGGGALLALRTFQLNRALISSAVLGCADTALRHAVAVLPSGRGGVSRGGRQRAVVAGVFADLLLCDAMATVVLRSLHALPDSGHLGAAAVKYLVPDLVREDLEELGTVLGAPGFRRDGERGHLQKLLRDLPAAGLGHMGTAACQAVLLPQLPFLAAESWERDPEPPEALFRCSAPLEPLDLAGLAVAGGSDFLVASLVGAVERLRDTANLSGYGPVLRAFAEGFRTQLLDVRAGFAALAARGPGALAGPAACALADRYVLVAAAGAVLGCWLRQDGGDPFLTDPAWPVLALSRLAGRLGMAGPELPAGCVERVFNEVAGRFREGRSFDLHAAPLWER
ncbi:acyl-CoA dehydrogenase [Streptomyces sp. NPDC017993]|uniref:acyl-CoA dehydrogenase n=1 Tax=Streptomyces sp. NPDC017993 TaxID=3365027 RepID=UPI0037885352